MAVLGIQLVITMVMASVLHKITTRFSIAKWLLSRKLVRYLHPTDDQIMEMANLTRATGKKNKNKENHATTNRHRNRRDNNSSTEELVFKIPRNSDYFLEATKVRPDDLIELKFYPEFQWLVDLSICALVVFSVTEAFYHWFPNHNRQDELNLSLIWCLLVMGFTFKILLSLTRMYFSSDESIGERSMVITAGCLFFLFAMVILIADENFLELGLNPAYNSFNSSAYTFLERHGVSHAAHGPLSKLLFKFWLAVGCGLTGAIFMFPGLRFGQMHKDCLQFMKGHRITQVLLNVSFVSPLFIILFWVKPLARGYLTEKYFIRMGGFIMTSESFESFRIVFVLFVLLLRVVLTTGYLQSYLNLAPNRLVRMKKEAGKITNIELKRLVAGVFYYLCVVTLQFIGPVLLILFSTLLFKVLGDHKWAGTLIYPASSTSSFMENDSTKSSSSLRSVFTPLVWHGLLGFTTWWLNMIWFVTSTIGFIYHSYYST